MPEEKRSGGPGGGPGNPGRHGFQKPKNVKKTLSQLMRYVGRYKLLLLVVLLCLFVSAAANVAGSYLLKPLINDYIVPGDFPGLIRMLAMLAGIFLLGAATSYAYSRLMVFISQKCVFALRTDLFAKMQDLPLSYFDSHTHGELMSRYTNDIDTISDAINNSFANCISSIVTFIGVLIMMLVLSPLMTLVSVIFLAIMLLVVQFIGKRSKRSFQEQQKALGALNGYIEEMVEGQKVVKVFCREEAAKAEFREKNDTLRSAATAAQTYSGSMMPAMGNLSHINFAVNCCVGALLAIAGRFDVGSLIAFLQYVRQFSQPITQVSQQVNIIFAALAGAERVFEVMGTPSEPNDGKVILVSVKKTAGVLTETAERTGAWAWKSPDGKLTPLCGDVRFRDVVFGYTPDRDILKDISLYAKPGQKIAFVGSTGAGKTTIINLITRFYDIRSGAITYDGIDVRDIEKSSLRRSLGMVLQDTHLFTGTIADNIRYGRPDATDEEVVAAAKLANAHSFIKRLPQGYQTLLSGDGGNLSQGQRQLLAIARAAVAAPPVLILDEATSSIDTRTEKLIGRGMDQLMEGRTVFVIAHRLSTVRDAEAIMVLEGGEIIERGSHDELMAQKGRYWKLCTGSAVLD